MASMFRFTEEERTCKGAFTDVLLWRIVSRCNAGAIVSTHAGGGVALRHQPHFIISSLCSELGPVLDCHLTQCFDTGPDCMCDSM